MLPLPSSPGRKPSGKGHVARYIPRTYPGPPKGNPPGQVVEVEVEATSLISIIGRALQQLNLSREEQAVWSRIKEQEAGNKHIRNTDPGLKQIQSELKVLTAAVAKLSSPKLTSWAQVATP
jgi:hypothetical protein